jgi:hypothetical protein
MDIFTDGAVSDVTGIVDLGKWPEQLYHVRSRIQFPRMREIFFATNTFDLHGEGQFEGTFHLFKGGRELKGNFYSREAGLNFYRFPDLEGSLVWVPDRLEVTRASSRFYGGHMNFTYLMSPLNVRGQRSRSRFVVDYRDVDLIPDRLLHIEDNPWYDFAPVGGLAPTLTVSETSWAVSGIEK